jgi:hypothetical protein
MEASAKETVIIVHGTNAAPDGAAPRWYQPGGGTQEGFVYKLDAALAKRGSKARCWAHWAKGTEIFWWSGKNSWIERTKAAAKLANYVAALRNEGWRCHIVAHSHGGNVLAEALPQITASATSAAPLGKLIALGTPFMDVMSPIMRADRGRQHIVLGITFMFAVTWLLALFEQYRFGSGKVDIEIAIFALPPFLLIFGLIFRWQKTLRKEPWSSYAKRHWHSIAITLVIWGFLGLWLRAIYWKLHIPILQDIFGNVNSTVLSISAISLVVVILVYAYWQGYYLSPYSDFWQLDEAVRTETRFLVIGSKKDEAWELLHHIQSSDNPLAISNPFTYILLCFRSSLSQRSAVDHIHYGISADIGAVKFVSVIFIYLLVFAIFILLRDYLNKMPMFFGDWLGHLFFTTTVVLSIAMFLGFNILIILAAPVLICLRLIWATTSLIPALITYIVRREGWSIVQKIVLGLEGYEFRTPAVEQRPTFIGANIVKYENMPDAVERYAQNNQTAWIKGHIADISMAFSKPVVTTADALSLLHTIWADQSLVHAAYYSDDECIDRIADWIAGRG